MASLADSYHSATSTLAPCKRCGELLQQRVRFCPECGKDQSNLDEPGDPSVADYSAPGGLDEPVPLALLTSPSLMLYDQVEEAMRQEVVPPPPQDACSAFGVATSIGFVRPGALLHHEARTAGNDRHVRWADRVTPNRLLIGLMALLVAGLMFALGQEAFLNWRHELGSQQVARSGQGTRAERAGFVEGSLANSAVAPVAPAPSLASAAPLASPAAAAAPGAASVASIAPSVPSVPRAMTVSAPEPVSDRAQPAPLQAAALVDSAPSPAAQTLSSAPPQPAADTPKNNECSGALAALSLCRSN